MFERSPEDVVRGVFRFTLGETEYVMPTLSWDDSEEWHERVRKELAGALETVDIEVPSDVLVLVNRSMGTMVELIAAYDISHKLGRNEKDIRRHDRQQLYEVFKAIVRHEFPLTGDLRTVAESALPVVRPLIYQTLVAFGPTLQRLMTGMITKERPSSRDESSNTSSEPVSTPEPLPPVSIATRSESSSKRVRSA